MAKAVTPHVAPAGSPLDVARVRADFPLLARREGDRPLVYLDSAATSQKPLRVIEEMDRYWREYNANVHRGVYRMAQEATEAYEEAHRKVARFIGAPGLENIVFTKNTTEAINLVAYAWGLSHLKTGTNVVTTQMEHHSNIVPWQQICRMTGAELRFVPVTEDGRLNLAAAADVIDGNTKLVTCTHMSNVLGTINDVAAVGKLAHGVGALFLVDGAQSVPHLPVDVAKLDCDLMAFSGHKMCGPTGVGVLYGKKEVLDAMPPFLFGGEMIKRVSWKETRFNDLPWKFEAGTPVIAEGIGLGHAVDYLASIGMEKVHAHEQWLVSYAMERLARIEGLRMYGPPAKERGGVVAFNLGEVHAHDLSSLLDDHGVAVRAGHHCAQPLMEHLGAPATARASFYLYNTREEIDALHDALVDARKVFL